MTARDKIIIALSLASIFVVAVVWLEMDYRKTEKQYQECLEACSVLLPPLEELPALGELPPLPKLPPQELPELDGLPELPEPLLAEPDPRFFNCIDDCDEKYGK